MSVITRMTSRSSDEGSPLIRGNSPRQNGFLHLDVCWFTNWPLYTYSKERGKTEQTAPDC